MFTSTTEEDSDDSVYKTGQKSRHLRISSSSSESDDSVIATHSRRKNNRVSSSSSESDDSSFGSPVRKKCKVLQMSDSETSETADSDVEVNRTSTQRRNRRALSSDLEESYNKVPALRETTPQAEAGSSDSDDGERCIICFKTLRPPFAHPSNCTHKFHPICLSTWSKTSNTCPIDRVKYTSIHKVGHQGDLISQERVTTPPPQDHNADFEPDQATFCEVCSQHDREHEMLLCDRCEAGYHLDCLTPPLREVPEGSWFCPSCTDFGNELAEEVSGLMDDAAVILETRMRRRTGVQPRVPRGPRTRGAQRVFDIIHRQATMNQPSTSSSVTVRRRQTSRRTRKSKSRRKPRSTHYKVELITVEDGTTLEVKVAVNTRSKARRYSKRSSKKKCSKGSRKNVNSAKPSNSNLSTSRDGPSHSLDLFGNRPQLDYFSSCEAEDELDEDGGGGLGLMHRSAVRTNIRSMASRKQIAAQIFNSRPRRPLPKIEASQAPIDLVSSIIQQQEKWLNSNASDYKLTSNGDIKEIIRDTKGTKLKQTAGGYSTSGNAGSTSSASASACETRRDVTTSGGGTSNGGGSSESASFHPLQPPPEPPSKLYEDDDFDLYADIEPPNSSKLAPPPEPPALLFALDGDDKDEVGGGSSPEDAGLVIDDRHDTYDPEMPTSPPSPPSPPPSKASMADNSKQSDAANSSAPCFVVALEDIPPPPTPPDEGSESECPNQGIYSKMSLEIAQGKGRADSSDDQVDEEGAVILDKEEHTNHEDEALSKSVKLSDDEGKEEEVELDLDKGKDSEMGDDVSSTNNEDNDKKDDDDEGDELDGGNQSDDGTEVISPEKNKTESEKMSDNEDKEAKGEEDFAIANGPDGADLKFNDKSSLNKSVEKDSEQEGEVLELGCEEERDGLVDITDEEMSNYERSWEMEDNTSKATKTAGLEGLETEAISDCEYPPVETELTENQNQDEKPVESEPKVKILENGNKEEEGEILAEEQRVPVQWKKLSKGTKDRSYRGDKDGKNKEKKKEILKKKEKRKELERYDVRKLISEKPRRKVDEFGRDISSNSRSASRSLSRNRKSPSQRRSVSRGKKRRSKSRSRSKERPKETRNARSRERGRDRSREKSWDRSKDKAAKDRSKERKSPVGRAKKKETRKERAKPVRKERGRSRDKSSRERKKRKKSPSMSCSSCSCSSCEREKRRSKKLTVIVPNEEAIEEPSREKGKGKYKKRASSPKRQRRRSPVPSKEVFTSGDNILVSVNFKSSTTNETGRRKEPSMSSKRKKEEESRRKKEKTSKENQTVRSIVTAKNPNKRKLNTKNIKPIAIIDLDASPFRETLLSPKEVIILTDSDSEDKITQTENNIPALVTGPKTPPEPHIKFNIVNNKQQQLRALSNPLLDSSLEQEGDGDDEPNEIMHKGPNTPPEPPVPYDPFEPTKSRSPTPCEIIDAERDPSPTPESNQRLSSPQQLQSSKTPPKVPQHESPKTPSPLRHSPPKVADEAADKQQKQQPFQAAVMDSDDDSTGGGGGGGGGGGDSPYSPGSSEGDDLFEPPQPLNSNAGVPKPKVRLPLPTVNKYVPLPSKAPAQQSQPKKRSGKAHKENSKKGSGKKEIGIKLDEDQLKILDELPNSAVEMQVKDKFLKKLNRQERVVEEVKLVLKPHYAKKHVTKEEYKEILRKSVPKICHSRSGEINPMKIQRLIEAYVKKYRHKAKKKGSGPAIPPLRQNKSKTLWC